MTKPKICSWRDCADDRKVRKLLEKNGYEIRESKGSHWVATGPAGKMVGYHGTMSTGVANKCWKFLKLAGLITVVLAYLFN